MLNTIGSSGSLTLLYLRELLLGLDCAEGVVAECFLVMSLNLCEQLCGSVFKNLGIEVDSF